MSSMKIYTSSKNQRGAFLVEAIVGMVLVALMAQAMLFITSRTSSVQSTLRLQEIAIHQMRSALMRNRSGTIDICAGAPTVVLPNNVSLQTESQGCDTTTTAQFTGASVSGVPKPIDLSVESDLLGGQLVVGGTWVETVAGS